MHKLEKIEFWLVILYLESIFGDIEGEEVEEDVGGGTEGSNSDMVARLKLKLDEKTHFHSFSASS